MQLWKLETLIVLSKHNDTVKIGKHGSLLILYSHVKNMSAAKNSLSKYSLKKTVQCNCKPSFSKRSGNHMYILTINLINLLKYIQSKSPCCCNNKRNCKYYFFNSKLPFDYKKKSYLLLQYWLFDTLNNDKRIFHLIQFHLLVL